MSTQSHVDAVSLAFVLMFPEVTHLTRALNAQLREFDAEALLAVIAIKDSNHPAAITHLAVPNLVLGINQAVRQRLTGKAVLVELQQFLVLIELQPKFRSTLV